MTNAMIKNDKRWIGDLLGGSLMVRESRTIAELLLSEPDETTWQQQIINENILQASSTSTANRYARTLRLRLMTLDRECWQLIADGSESERLQMLLVALMIQSPVVAEFIAEVVNPARQQFKEKLGMNCWSEFVDENLRLHPELAVFSDSSIQKMGNNLIKALAEAGYLDSPRRRNLQNVFLLPEVSTALHRLNKAELLPILGGSV
ncbi:DUF1819 family protein [Pectobacterium aroidearum]|uniref:DUF1819 family protein n=1 Tax=Pectobacterium aroidearum TaxID=1201031 RepID=UPI0015F000BB|nr:DUF1819 family protein [Pectobacterium aroidearum]MBA5237121.1 DUF1819 family protein [Pectobacterium aroidearum]